MVQDAAAAHQDHIVDGIQHARLRVRHRHDYGELQVVSGGAQPLQRVCEGSSALQAGRGSRLLHFVRGNSGRRRRLVHGHFRQLGNTRHALLCFDSVLRLAACVVCAGTTATGC